ncbi:hypothetical protein PQX77_008786 [Marasmius sp. AFHP31]|nr:hypothetical protein PQX77_008786 [Marasmius sp. AFHP31]
MAPVLIVATSEGHDAVKKLEAWLAREWLRAWPEEALKPDPTDATAVAQAKREQNLSVRRVRKVCLVGVRPPQYSCSQSLKELSTKLRLEAVTWRLADEYMRRDPYFQSETDCATPWTEMFHEALEDSRFHYFNIAS